MFFTNRKFRNRVEELGQRRYTAHSTLSPFVSMEGTLDKDAWYRAIPEKIEGSTFSLKDHFIGRDKYRWLEKKIHIPQAREGYDVVGLFDFGITSTGQTEGFESLLYVDGHPFQGVDGNHKEVFFEGYEGREVTLTFLLWTGMEGGGIPRDQIHQFKQADMVYLHKKTDELYYFGRAITETLEYLDVNSEDYAALTAAFDRALLHIRWDEDAIFYPSIDNAHAALMSELGKLEKHTQVTVHAVGHTHIDVAWLWRLKHTREKAQRSFATVMRLMERYDEYVFLQTQPQLYQYIKQDCPELYAQIQKRVAEGKWEADGGMWVEADCNLSSGESLVRQFLHGTRFFETEFGKKCEYLWLPDVFGYSWSLPQILKLCNINTFMTTKISWNQYNTIPDDLFLWRGIDGTEILTYFIDTPEVGIPIGDRYSTYNGRLEPRAIIGGWRQFKNKELSKDTLIAYGFGDGGGGVNRDMLEMRRAMDAIPGCPNVKTTTAGDFFRKIHKNVENTDRYVHTWDGELYLEYHRGTYTSQGYNKKTNRQLENQLTQLEWLSSLSYVMGGDYAQKKIHDIWECVLLHQFHDIIPGSSIHEVYEDSRVNYGAAQDSLRQVQDEVLKRLQREDRDIYTVYSSNSFAASELVTIPELRAGHFLDSQGNILPSQKVEAGYHVLVDTEPFGGVTIRFHENQEMECESAFTFRQNSMETPYYHLAWNHQGQLTEVYDKEANRQVLRAGQKGNVLEIYEDKPMQFDAWDIDIYYTEKLYYPELVEQPKLVEQGSLSATVRFCYRYHNSRIIQDMICYRHSKRIDFRTWVEWHEDQKLLKTAFYTDIRATKATYDIQFGHVERPTHWNNSWDWARFEVCAHKWADLSETGYGVSLINDCKYGHNIKDSAMKLSLLKSAKYPDYIADMGEHTFTYSLLPHQGELVSGGTIEAANQLNHPALVIPGTRLDLRRLVRLSSDGVQVDAIKKAEDEDCIIVRLHECRGGRATVKLSSDFPVTKIVSCNLLEQDFDAPELADSVEFVIKPFEIKTYKLYY